MGIRETLNRNPAIATGATLAIIVIAVGFIIYSQMGSSAAKGPTGAFYSDDDGKTWFADDPKLVPPFDHNGKEAVRARIFKCADGKEFVGYLERYSAEAKKTVDELNRIRQGADYKAGSPPQNIQAMAMTAQMGTEVKKPGDTKWVRMMDFPNSSKVTRFPCPDGSTGNPEPVTP